MSKINYINITAYNDYMIILSIDVGINNLAYCLLKKTKKTDILDWNIIDLANDNIETCKDCSKKANYTNKQYSVCKIIICNEERKLCMWQLFF